MRDHIGGVSRLGGDQAPMTAELPRSKTRPAHNPHALSRVTSTLSVDESQGALEAERRKHSYLW